MMSNNCLRSTILNSKSRRRGQALLLSVLIMIFIVLLGTTFIAIVASNMGNTARTGAKDEARQAAKAGLEFADKELMGSDDGLNWRPTLPTTTGNLYYTAFDRAQGWSQAFYKLTGNSTADDAYFVKYPSAQTSTPAETSAKFMLRVSQVMDGDPDNIGNTRTGDIRIESIGFASDDPVAYYKTVAYKKGLENNPLTAAMRSVSNWDWDVNGVVQGEVLAGATNNTFTVYNSSMKINGGFAQDDYITVWDKTGNRVTGAVISAVTPVDSNTVTLTITSAIPIPSTGSIVQKAVALSAPVSLKFDNATDTPIPFNISGRNNPYGTINNTPGSVWVNGGLVWYSTNPQPSATSTIYSTNLIAPSAGTSIDPASNIKVSGLYASISAAASYNSTRVYVAGTAKVAGTTTPISATLPSNSILATDTNTLISNELVEDGLNRMRGSLDPLRQVEDFTPPDITAGGDGLGRYRQLTQYSPPITWAINYPQAAAYGYGKGIYINNPQDVEKKDNLEPMTQSDLHNLWFTDGSVSSSGFERLQQPEAATATGKSLEQQHLRGWVSPDQFLPRGAEVVLNDNNTITVTLDSRTDNNSTTTCGTTPYPDCDELSQGAVPSKSWYNRDGNLLGDTTVGGVYTQTFAWPQNGTLFAEGNIRIRGVDSNATMSLTVVSMNNIYIDGSLQLGNNHKVLLLAKRNVVANPTQALQVIDPQTRLKVAIPSDGSTQTSITVYDGAGFRKGDLIEVENGSGNDRQLRVSGTPSGSPTTGYTIPVMAFSTTSAAYTVGTRVHLSTDPGLDVTGAYEGRPYTAAIRLSRFTHAIQRRVDLAAGTTDLRLAFRHSAEYRSALTIGTKKELPGPPTYPHTLISATLANKLVATSPESIIQAADKIMTVDYTEDPPNTPATDKFLQTPPTDQETAAATTLADLKTEMEALRTTPDWHYDVTVEHEYDHIHNPGANQYAIPFYFLAGVGNRYNYGVTLPGPGLPVRQDIFDPKTYTIPMATSVWLTMNGTPVQLQDNHWNASLNGGSGGFGVVNQFGFNPVYINSDGTNPISGDDWYDHEDVLTSDQYFYQPNTGTATSDEQPTSNTYANQTGYDDGTNTHYTLDSRDMQGFTVAAGSDGVDMAIQLDDGEVDPDNTRNVNDYFYTPDSTTADARIPFYRLSNLKIQNETLDTTSSHELVGFGSVNTMNIDAYVYAQEGSWQVIPGTYFDKDVKNSDDLNRDGVISPAETVAAYRYHRYNYQIVFTGAIMENEMAAPDDVTAWTDKWATVKMNPLTTTPSYNYDPTTSNLNTILYYYDPEAAEGVALSDTGFRVPVASGLVYQG